jgi:hypothetical protein
MTMMAYNMRENEYRMTLFAEAGNFDEIKKLVERGYRPQQEQSESLRYAARYGHIGIVKYLVGLGCKHDKVLINAVRSGHLDIVKYLITMGPNYAKDKYFAFVTACHKDRIDIVKYFIEELKYDIREEDSFPMAQCARQGHLDILKYLVERGHHMKNNGEVLLKCAEYGFFDVIEYLCEIGYGFQDKGNSAIIKSAENGHIVIVEYLVDMGYDFRSQNNEAFKEAVYGGHHDVCEYLLHLGCYPSKDLLARKKFFFLKYGLFFFLTNKDKCACLEFSTQDSFTATAFHFSEIESFCTKMICGKKLYKNNFLKFILKPTSLHTQLMLIE